MEKNSLFKSGKAKLVALASVATAAILSSAPAMAALDGKAAADEIVANQPGLIVIGTAVIATLAVICGFQYAKRLL